MLEFFLFICSKQNIIIKICGTIASVKITNVLALWFADRQRDIIKSEIKNARAGFSAVVAASASIGSCNLSSHL
jgi:hypothetical protein